MQVYLQFIHISSYFHTFSDLILRIEQERERYRQLISIVQGQLDTDIHLATQMVTVMESNLKSLEARRQKLEYLKLILS